MVLHVRSDELDGSVLSRVDDRLALTEEHGGLEVGGCLVLYDNRFAVEAVVELLLEVADLAVFVSNLAILAIEGVAQVVDGSVERIDLSLVASRADGEVMSTIGVAEFVNETDVQLYKRVVDVVLRLVLVDVTTLIERFVTKFICFVAVEEQPSDGRFELELELFFRAEVECEVDTRL